MTRVTQRQLDAYDYLHAKGLHEKGAPAGVGNFVQESGEDLNSTMFRAHPDASGGVAQHLKSGGIAEWLGSRKTGYLAFARSAELSRGVPPDSLVNDLETQCDYVIHELKNGDDGKSPQQYAELWRQLTTETLDNNGKPRTIATLTANFMDKYERPKAGPTAGLNNRIEHAEAVYERAQLIKAAEGQPTPIPMPTPTVPIPPIVYQEPPIGGTVGEPSRDIPPSVVIGAGQERPPTPTAPAGPPISASTAGRQAAGQSIIETTLANLYAERASIEDEISVWEGAKTGYIRLPTVPALDAPLALPKPDEPHSGLNPVITPKKRTQTMFGKSWITSVLGVGTIGSAVASIGIDIANRKMPDWSEIMLVIASIGGGSIGLAAKDKAVTGGTISAATGAVTNQPVSIVDDGAGGRVPSTNSRVGPDGRFIR